MRSVDWADLQLCVHLAIAAWPGRRARSAGSPKSAPKVDAAMLPLAHASLIACAVGGIMKHVYRGYSILYYRAAGWLAYLYPPGAIRAVDEIVQATAKEGPEVLLARVRQKINSELKDAQTTKKMPS